MDRCRRNPSQPPDLTVPHQGARDGDRYPNERNDHDHRNIEVDDIQPGVADIPRDGFADEAKDHQQDGREADADTKSAGLTKRKFRLHLEQRGDLPTRPAAQYLSPIRRHTWTSSDTLGVASLVSLMKASSRFPLLASNSATWTPFSERAFKSA